MRETLGSIVDESAWEFAMGSWRIGSRNCLADFLTIFKVERDLLVEKEGCCV